MKPNTVILGWPNSWRKREDDGTKVFVDTIRNAASGKMALLVPKGIQRYPDTGDTVKVSTQWTNFLQKIHASASIMLD